MEGCEGGGGDLDGDKGSGFVLLLGVRGSGRWFQLDNDRVSSVIEEFNGAEGYGGVTRSGEGCADFRRGGVAFSINGKEVERKKRAEGLKDGFGREPGDVGADRREDSAKSNLL